MRYKNFPKVLRFYFIIDYEIRTFTPYDQVLTAIQAGATTIQYRNKNFTLDDYDDIAAICSLCRKNRVMFIVNDDVLLAKYVNADGVHLGQDDENITSARKILGTNAIVGLSISNIDELKNSNISHCDYIGVGPIFSTTTKHDAKPPQGLNTLNKIVLSSSVPVVAIGGINPINAKKCVASGAHGIAVISYISRSKNPIKSAKKLASILS